MHSLYQARRLREGRRVYWMAVSLAESKSKRKLVKFNETAKSLGYQLTMTDEGIVYRSKYHGGFVSYAAVEEHREGKYCI